MQLHHGLVLTTVICTAVVGACAHRVLGPWSLVVARALLNATMVHQHVPRCTELRGSRVAAARRPEAAASAVASAHKDTSEDFEPRDGLAAPETTKNEHPPPETPLPTLPLNPLFTFAPPPPSLHTDASGPCFKQRMPHAPSSHSPRDLFPPQFTARPALQPTTSRPLAPMSLAGRK